MYQLSWLAALSLVTVAGAQDLQTCGGTQGRPQWVSPGVYQGTIGSFPVALQISQTDTYTRYVYLNRGIPLALQSFRRDQQLIFQETVEKGYRQWEVTGCFSLNAAHNGLKGTWRTPDGKTTYPVTLQPVAAERVPLKLRASPEVVRLRRENAFDFLRINHALIKSPDGRRWTESRSGLQYPLPAQASAGVLEAVQDRLILNALDKLNCRGLAPETDQDAFWFDFQAQVTFQSAHLLTLQEGGTAFCGGVHPSLMFETFTLNRQTGQPVNLTDLWPKLTLERLGQLYRQSFPKDQGLAPCRAEWGDAIPKVIWTLTARGVALFSQTYIEANRNCRSQDVTVPYARFRAEANPKSVYYADIYGGK